MTVPVTLGAEWWAEPMEQPADRHTLQQYDVDEQVLARWRAARSEYLSARAALVGQIERQGWRAPTDRPAMMSVPDAAREMQVGTSTVYRLVSVNGGPIPSIRLGAHTIRIPRQAFEQWLQTAGTVEGAADPR